LSENGEGWWEKKEREVEKQEKGERDRGMGERDLKQIRFLRAVAGVRGNGEGWWEKEEREDASDATVKDRHETDKRLDIQKCAPVIGVRTWKDTGEDDVHMGKRGRERHRA
jgi:hypothetical protein